MDLAQWRFYVLPAVVLSNRKHAGIPSLKELWKKSALAPAVMLIYQKLLQDASEREYQDNVYQYV